MSQRGKAERDAGMHFDAFVIHRPSAWAAVPNEQPSVQPLADSRALLRLGGRAQLIFLAERTPQKMPASDCRSCTLDAFQKSARWCRCRRGCRRPGTAPGPPSAGRPPLGGPSSATPSAPRPAGWPAPAHGAPTFQPWIPTVSEAAVHRLNLAEIWPTFPASTQAAVVFVSDCTRSAAARVWRTDTSFGYRTASGAFKLHWCCLGGAFARNRRPWKRQLQCTTSADAQCANQQLAWHQRQQHSETAFISKTTTLVAGMQGCCHPFSCQNCMWELSPTCLSGGRMPRK